MGHTITMNHTGERLIIIGGYNSKNGHLNTVDVLSNVDQPLKNWHFGDKHNGYPAPKNITNNMKGFILIFFIIFYNLYFF
jgi:hypothetical protein